MNSRVPGMACPNDGTSLVMSERQGIEIDHCPTCRGVWLDRSELDRIIERSTPEAPTRDQYREQPQYHPQPHGYGHKHKRRKSFLEDLFD